MRSGDVFFVTVTAARARRLSVPQAGPTSSHDDRLRGSAMMAR
jgi:hypothetical protein